MSPSRTTHVDTRTAVRPWLPATVSRRVSDISGGASALRGRALQIEIERLAEKNHQIHDVTCLNLNPATNIMNPRAEALMATGLGSRASLGYPGEKYETGLEAIEQIEVLAADAATRVFGACYAEVRVASGALSNLYAFMATCRPGDTIIAPPAAIGGHVTHHQSGAAGLYGLQTLSAPVDADGYTVDVESLRTLAHEVRPKLITIGGSLNLFPHPVGEIRGVADEVGALVLFDAAHQCGMFAGKAWPDPLADGAHLMTMSTYKSLGGPPGGLIVTNEADLAERLEAIAYPGLTANFDAGKTAALALTLADWEVAGPAYARTMIETAQALAAALASLGVPVFAAERGATASHQFAILAHPYGGGQQAAGTLRLSNLLACGIGLPGPPLDGDLNGLRIGTPEIVRLGMTRDDMPQLASFIARGLADDTGSSGIGDQVTRWRAQFRGCHFTADAPT